MYLGRGTLPKISFDKWSIWWLMGLAVINMMSMTSVIPGLHLYVTAMGESTEKTGYAFAAYPLGAIFSTWLFKNVPHGPILEFDDEKGTIYRQRLETPCTRWSFCLLILVGVAGHVLYAMSYNLYILLAARFLVGFSGGSMVLIHKFFEYSTSGDDSMVRSRMVILGAVQVWGGFLGIVLSLGVSFIPVTISNVLRSELKTAGVISAEALVGYSCATLYLLTIPGVFWTYVPIESDVLRYVDSFRGEMDAAPPNYMAYSRVGCIVPAVIYDRGFVVPASLPDVFTTTVILVMSFFYNGLMIGIEVTHGIFTSDSYSWNVSYISASYLGFYLSGMVGIAIGVMLSGDVPCNRRVLMACMTMFVSYGGMMQAHTEWYVYVPAICLIFGTYYVCDLAFNEIYIDKMGDEMEPRRTAASKMMLMGLLNTTQSYARVLGCIITGHLYSYYSHADNVNRRPYAVYGCGLAVALLLVVLTVVFYKRMVLRAAEALAPEKSLLQAPQIDCG